MRPLTSAYREGVQLALAKFGTAGPSTGGMSDTPHSGWFEEPTSGPSNNPARIDQLFTANNTFDAPMPSTENTPFLNATLNGVMPAAGPNRSDQNTFVSDGVSSS